MHALKEAANHLEATDGVPARRQKTWTIVGLILLVVAAIGFYQMWPELRRYMRIERM